MSTKKADESLNRIGEWLAATDRAWFEQLKAGFLPMWDHLGQELSQLLKELASARAAEEKYIYQRLGEKAAQKLRRYFAGPLPELDFSLEAMRSALLAMAQEFPETEAEFLSDQRLKIDAEERFSVRVWKLTMKIRQHRRRTLYRLDNALRRRFRVTLRPTPNYYRQIPLRDWVTYTAGVFAAQRHYLLQRAFFQFQTDAFLKIHILFEQKIFQLADYGTEEMDEAALLDKFQEALVQVYEICRNMSEQAQQWYAEKLLELQKSWSERQLRLEWERSYAGTAVLPRQTFRFRRLERRLLAKESRIQSDLDVWRKFFKGEWSEWQKDLQLQLLRFQTIQATEKLKEELDKTVNKALLPQFQLLADTVENAYAGLLQEDKSGNIKLILKRSKVKLLKKLRDKELPRVMGKLLDTRFETLLTNYRQQIRTIFSGVDKRQSVFRIHESRSDLPRFSIDTVPFADLMQEEVLQVFLQSFKEIADEMQKMEDQLFRDISEIDQIIEYNLEGSINLIGQEESEKIFETGLEGLRRGINQIEDIKSYLTEKTQALENDIFEAIGNLLLKVRDLADAEKVLELRLRWARSRTKKRARLFLRQFINSINHLIPLLIEKIKSLLNRMSREYRRLRKVTGLGSAGSENPAAYISYLVKAEKKLHSLPYIYQQLFKIEALTDRRFFAGRERELKELAAVWNDFSQDFISRVIISGEKGSGRSTLLYFLKKQIPSGTDIIELTIPAPISTEEQLLKIINNTHSSHNFSSLTGFEDFLIEKEERAILIVENLHYLFQKTMSGFQLLNRFIQLLGTVRSNVLVVAAMNDNSWRYLKQTQQFDRNFDRHISLEPLSVDDTEAIILKRHRISGYELYFLSPEGTAHQRKLKQLGSPEKQQDYIRHYFFEKLHELSRGNISAAIFLWQSAISEVSRETISIKPEIDYDTSFLQFLEADDLFILTAILQHEKLSAELIAHILIFPLEKTKMHLSQLTRNKIVLQTDDYYGVHPLAYRYLLRILKTRNYLH
jgi:hypothetical protein